ncbi:hypothetical protein OBBRIDRAFT_319804 [Obba rivulosa]|uniref:Uncharacterized protein n=1 Tax=Obba rivulosa TaxID=1052685 RepID=A0A8E2DPM1_9APHY|nr:hypothetical protein OBBRIDRAFT_319804 [Obba rivulosa]
MRHEFLSKSHPGRDTRCRAGTGVDGAQRLDKEPMWREAALAKTRESRRPKTVERIKSVNTASLQHHQEHEDKRPCTPSRPALVDAVNETAATKGGSREHECKSALRTERVAGLFGPATPSFFLITSRHSPLSSRYLTLPRHTKREDPFSQTGRIVALLSSFTTPQDLALSGRSPEPLVQLPISQSQHDFNHVFPTLPTAVRTCLKDNFHPQALSSRLRHSICFWPNSDNRPLTHTSRRLLRRGDLLAEERDSLIGATLLQQHVGLDGQVAMRGMWKFIALHGYMLFTECEDLR